MNNFLRNSRFPNWLDCNENAPQHKNGRGHWGRTLLRGQVNRFATGVDALAAGDVEHASFSQTMFIFVLIKLASVLTTLLLLHAMSDRLVQGFTGPLDQCL